MVDNMNRLIIGLYGGIASGKSYVSNIFHKNGFYVIDADSVYHSIIGPSSHPSKCSLEICAHFGDYLIQGDNSIDRKKLSKIVYQKNTKNNLEILSSITHKYIKKEISILINKKSKKDIVIEAPLLFESGIDKECNCFIYVEADYDERVRRLQERNNISKQDSITRIDSQKIDSVYKKKANYIIHNDGNDVIEQIQDIILKLRT